MDTERTWHINCLELRAGHLALKHCYTQVRNQHVLIRSDNMAVIAYINCHHRDQFSPPFKARKDSFVVGRATCVYSTKVAQQPWILDQLEL